MFFISSYTTCEWSEVEVVLFCSGKMDTKKKPGSRQCSEKAGNFRPKSGGLAGLHLCWLNQTGLLLFSLHINAITSDIESEKKIYSLMTSVLLSKIGRINKANNFRRMLIV